jgi:hypothetical protein
MSLDSNFSSVRKQNSEYQSGSKSILKSGENSKTKQEDKKVVKWKEPYDEDKLRSKTPSTFSRLSSYNNSFSYQGGSKFGKYSQKIPVKAPVNIGFYSRSAVISQSTENLQDRKDESNFSIAKIQNKLAEDAAPLMTKLFASTSGFYKNLTQPKGPSKNMSTPS